MRTKQLQPSGVVLRMVAGFVAAASVVGASAGCSTVASTELMIEVRTKDLHFAPDTEPADIDEIEIRILRLVGSAAELEDAGPRDAGPLTDAALDDAAALDASADDAGLAPDLDAAVLDAAAPDAAAPASDAGITRADAGAVVVPTRCPPRAAAFADGPYVFAEKWCGRYAIPRGARPPLTLGLVPSDGESSSALIEVRATAFLAGREVVGARRLAGFVPHMLKRVPPLVLSEGCIGVVCPPEQTCNDDVCVPLEVPPICLPAPGVDAGPAWSSCGAEDGGMDAGPPDAGPPDAGPSCGDGSCNGDETCDTCAMDCGACGPVCGDGSCDGDETCDSCRDCQNHHQGTRPFMEPCDSSLSGVWRCVTVNGGPCSGSRVSQRCQGGAWAIWSCNPANCARCVCTGSLDRYCMDAP